MLKVLPTINLSLSHYITTCKEQWPKFYPTLSLTKTLMGLQEIYFGCVALQEMVAMAPCLLGRHNNYTTLHAFDEK